MRLRWFALCALASAVAQAQPPQVEAQRLQQQMQQQAQQLQMQQQMLGQQVQDQVLAQQLARQNEQAPAGGGTNPLGLPSGVWWERLEMIDRLKITPDQRSRMNEIWQQGRLHLVDLTAALQKEQMVLEPLLAADAPDVAKVNAQVDRIARARADVEKATLGMQLAVRGSLTPEQRAKLAGISR